MPAEVGGPWTDTDHATMPSFDSGLAEALVRLFRPDGVLQMDARYMLEAEDGALILLHNRGFLWGRTPDVIPRIQDWMFRGGPPVPHSEFYLRAAPTFEVSTGPHDWLTRHVFVGVGDRYADGNIIRYYALL